MDILKLIVVFGIIVVVLWRKKPLVLAVLAAEIGAVLLYGLSLTEALGAFWRGTTSWTTVRTLLVFYSITYLQRMMERRGNLRDAHMALNGLFNNNRVNASLVPFIVGMLPAAGTVLLCGPIVRDSVKDSLSVPEAACVTSYFRHVSESFLPTYASIYLALAFAEGRVTPSAFLLAMAPMVAALFFSGWLIYLRRIPADTGMTADRSRSYYWKLLCQSLWAIGSTIVLILLFNVPVLPAVAVNVAINVAVNRFGFGELTTLARSAFEVKLLCNTWLLMTFKEVLDSTGVVAQLPEFFMALPIPLFLVYALVFFFGTVVAGTQAIVVLCMPMAMAAVPAGHTGLALFVLLLSVTYAAMQISPTHICLHLCAEDFHVPLGQMMAKTLPLVAVFTALSLGYYGVLSWLGF